MRNRRSRLRGGESRLDSGHGTMVDDGLEEGQESGRGRGERGFARGERTLRDAPLQLLWVQEGVGLNVFRPRDDRLGVY